MTPSSEVRGHQKQGASFGYTGVRGLNAIFATLKTVTGARILFRADSAFCTFAAIPVARWTAIKYTHAVYDEDITGRLIVRRIPELNKNKDTGQATLFDHAFAQPSPTPT